jgi:hypothetical protein
MRRIWEIVSLALLLIACAPSQASIQTAIAQTQAALPTATASHTPQPTATPTATPVPSATHTAVPSATLEPGATRPPTLADAILSHAEVDGVLPGWYLDSPLNISGEIFSQGEERQGWLFSGRGAEGSLIVYLIRWANETVARAAARSLFGEERQGGEVLDYPLNFNQFAGMVYSPSKDSVLLVYSSGLVMVYIDMDVPAGRQPGDLGDALAGLGRAQLDKLEQAGFR